MNSGAQVYMATIKPKAPAKRPAAGTFKPEAALVASAAALVAEATAEVAADLMLFETSKDRTVR